MWKMWLSFGLVSLVVSILGLVHQKLRAGIWFQWKQFWNHEPLIGVAICVDVTLIIVAVIEYRRRSKT